MPTVAGFYNALPSPAQLLLQQWAASLSREHVGLLLSHVHQFVTMRILSQTAEERPAGAQPYASNSDPKVGAAVPLMRLFWRANLLRVPKRRQGQGDDIVVFESGAAAPDGAADDSRDADSDIVMTQASGAGGRGSGGRAAGSSAAGSSAAGSSAAGGSSKGAGAEADAVDRAAALDAPEAPLPVADFVNETLCENMHVTLDILEWMRVLQEEEDAPAFRISFAETAPFLLDTPTKAKCLNTENRFRQRMESRTNIMEVGEGGRG